jgi:ankyrin repeat protein
MSAAEVVGAIQSGNLAKLRDLLAGDASLASSRDATGVSAIMHAVYRQNREALTLLRRAQPALDVFEATCLGEVARLTELVTADPDLVNAGSADGFTPLHLAAYFRHEQAALLLLSRGADVAAVARNPTRVMPLHSAASSRNLPVVVELLTRNAPVNARQQHGWTALHAAALNGDQEMVEVLLQHGADPRAQNDEGKTPSNLAEEKGHARILERLQGA